MDNLAYSDRRISGKSDEVVKFVLQDEIMPADIPEQGSKTISHIASGNSLVRVNES